MIKAMTGFTLNLTISSTAASTATAVFISIAVSDMLDPFLGECEK
ncbi:hypothetical protein [Glutamicibacter ardleyensis]